MLNIWCDSKKGLDKSMENHQNLWNWWDLSESECSVTGMWENIPEN